MHYLNGYLMDCTSMSENGDRSYIYYKQCNEQGTWIIFSQASIVQFAQNLIEITFAVVVGVSKKTDNILLTEAKQKYFFVSFEIWEICSPVEEI